MNIGVIGVGRLGICFALLLDRAGAMSFPWALLILSLIALVTVWINSQHSFKPGRRVR